MTDSLIFKTFEIYLPDIIHRIQITKKKPGGGHRAL